jgi:type IV pilus modification protein PilV
MRRSGVIFTRGFTLIEVLVTLLITTVTLLGFIGLQNRAQVAELEASQRAFASFIASFMVEQIKANPEIGSDCSFPSKLNVGTGTSKGSYGCAANLAGQTSIRNWHKELMGENETISSGTIKIGGIKNGRGCIQYTAPTINTRAKYVVSVAWQGFQKTVSGGSSGSCGYGNYGDSTLHRLLSYEVYGPEVNMKSDDDPDPGDGFIPSSIGCPWIGSAGPGSNIYRNHESFYGGKKSCLLGDYVDEEHPHLHHMSGSPKELWINGNITIKYCGGCFDDAAATIYYTGSNINSCSLGGTWPSQVTATKVTQAQFNQAADAVP